MTQLYKGSLQGTFPGDPSTSLRMTQFEKGFILALPRRFLHALRLVKMTQSDGNLHYLVDFQTTSAEDSTLEVHKMIMNG